MNVKSIFLAIVIVFFSFFWKGKSVIKLVENPLYVSHVVNLKYQNLKFYWKNSIDVNYNNFENLKAELSILNKKLIFAMNGGMYKKDLSPQGLYVENGITLTPLDTITKGYGNFYLQPNGVFAITKNNKALIIKSTNFNNDFIKFATQSGPLLIIEGIIHTKFNKGSKNVNIRNGVGILPNGDLIFAMSLQKVNFYEFATYFNSLGCKNALYLDGFVSKTFLPEKNQLEMDGNFGVIIAETD